MEIQTESLYWWGIGILLISAAASFTSLLFITAPYGRYLRSGWGPTLPSRLAWIVMELPAPLCFALAFVRGTHAGEGIPLLFLGLWQLHYLQRTFVYPLLMRGSGKRTVLATFGMALVFNVLNGTVNGIAVSHFGSYGEQWLTDPRFLVGVMLFLGGYAINLHSDAVLRGLRSPGETGYKIPQGGCFRWVSSANYFGEIVEWCGWALATWTAAGFTFALFTVANLLPRALSHHRWYREQFPDYPKNRKAVIPGLL
jgi:protein-S-isoprenylcysteine O-methyltransferase Ste14